MIDVVGNADVLSEQLAFSAPSEKTASVVDGGGAEVTKHLPHQIEYGGGWVHWHQPHTYAEITRAGLTVELSDDAERVGWYVGDERRSHGRVECAVGAGDDLE